MHNDSKKKLHRIQYFSIIKMNRQKSQNKNTKKWEKRKSYLKFHVS